MASELSDTWKAITLRVANSFIGVSGFSLLLYSLWMIGVCVREGKFMFACLAVGGSFCVIACLGYLGASGIASQVLLSIKQYIFLMFMVLIVEILVGADVILNKHWRKDFPKDRTGMFDDFVKYVESNYDVFRLIWILIGLSQVMSFGLAMVLKFSDYRAGIDYERLPLLAGSQPRFVSNKIGGQMSASPPSIPAVWSHSCIHYVHVDDLAPGLIRLQTIIVLWCNLPHLVEFVTWNSGEIMMLVVIAHMPCEKIQRAIWPAIGCIPPPTKVEAIKFAWDVHVDSIYSLEAVVLQVVSQYSKPAIVGGSREGQIVAELMDGQEEVVVQKRAKEDTEKGSCGGAKREARLCKTRRSRWPLQLLRLRPWRPSLECVKKERQQMKVDENNNSPDYLKLCGLGLLFNRRGGPKLPLDDSPPALQSSSHRGVQP
ncbi:hypothetical protein V2J09_009918 [Rumex salicifolius]